MGGKRPFPNVEENLKKGEGKGANRKAMKRDRKGTEKLERKRLCRRGKFPKIKQKKAGGAIRKKPGGDPRQKD